MKGSGLTDCLVLPLESSVRELKNKTKQQQKKNPQNNNNHHQKRKAERKRSGQGSVSTTSKKEATWRGAELLLVSVCVCLCVSLGFTMHNIAEKKGSGDRQESWRDRW